MRSLLLLLFTALPFFISAQTVTVKITLNAVEGGVHSFMNVTLVDVATNAKFSGKTDALGKVSIAVPPNASYEVKIPNYTAKKIINVPNAPGATMSSSLTYSRNMVAQDAAFAMSDAEKKEVDDFVNALPDTTWFKNGRNPFAASSETYYASFELGITDFDKKPLDGEIVTLVGRKNKKAFKAVTGVNGKVMMWLPKGDDYDLSFFYHKNYEYNECKYSKGTSEIRWEFSYIGTKAYAKIKKAEEERLAAEKKRLEEERAAFLEYCRVHKVSEEEGVKLKLKEEMARSYGGTDLSVQQALDRNQFKNPLIVTDVTGSMSPYMAQLQGWFKINATKNPTAQFVFFNDGDNKSDASKVIGNTGGIYYTPSVPVEQLLSFMSMASGKGSGGDGPENNMEALIKGVKMAKNPYTDIVMIADNNAPVKDISLLSQFTSPVHIIVCGSNGNFVHPDYLRIAWKTKGSIHTADADYTNIGSLKDGETIKIGLSVYRLMKGEFIQI